MTIAAAPASSRRRTIPRSSTRGDAPGISGCGSSRPRYVVERSTASPFLRALRGRGDEVRHLRRVGQRRELLVVAEPAGRLLLGEGGKLLRAVGAQPLEHPEAVLVLHVLLDLDLRLSAVELEGRLTGLDAARIEPVERPHAAVHGELLLLAPVGHVVAVGDAVAV